MKRGDWVAWIEPKHWPPHLIEVLEKYKIKYGEGPFQVIDVIQEPDSSYVVFIDKNGNTVTESSLWFEMLASKETPTPSIH